VAIEEHVMTGHGDRDARWELLQCQAELGRRMARESGYCRRGGWQRRLPDWIHAPTGDGPPQHAPDVVAGWRGAQRTGQTDGLELNTGSRGCRNPRSSLRRDDSTPELSPGGWQADARLEDNA